MVGGKQRGGVSPGREEGLWETYVWVRGGAGGGQGGKTQVRLGKDE